MDKTELLLERLLKTNESYLFFYKSEENLIKSLIPFRLPFLVQSEKYKSAQIADNDNLLFSDNKLDKKQIRQIRIDFLRYLIDNVK